MDMNENEGLVKYISLVADLLENRNYKIDYYTYPTSFHANHNDHYWKCIEVHADMKNKKVEIRSNIHYQSDGKTKRAAVKEFSKMYDEVQSDIDYVNEQLNNRYSMNNVIRMLEICGVPKDIIEKIQVKEDKSEWI